MGQCLLPKSKRTTSSSPSVACSSTRLTPSSASDSRKRRASFFRLPVLLEGDLPVRPPTLSQSTILVRINMRPTPPVRFLCTTNRNFFAKHERLPTTLVHKFGAPNCEFFACRMEWSSCSAEELRKHQAAIQRELEKREANGKTCIICDSHISLAPSRTQIKCSSRPPHTRHCSSLVTTSMYPTRVLLKDINRLQPVPSDFVRIFQQAWLRANKHLHS